ncbi:hypothetical protein K1T35_47590 (plasmid) [Pseudonocardia sp. DSM 110487]|uniref:hypothetical protein n=1 Tax=Pseudonocardia sp. DSM 110487 TaxID=2865833 RepID=UPI001C69D33C|nr:hypothetical protein [Pseudonocardia sp. DSM 110487]QYN41014.1 hypothetical protein K1T35_47590 [Pseudonocardia sp. DSM 110487]
MAVVGPFVDEDFDTITARCPECQNVTEHERTESLNFGNQIARCTACDCEWNVTPVDEKAILAEAQRGW